MSGKKSSHVNSLSLVGVPNEKRQGNEPLNAGAPTGKGTGEY